jgi:hypothetical protein
MRIDARRGRVARHSKHQPGRSVTLINPIRIRARSSIADPELARAAVVDLPAAPAARRIGTPQVLRDALAAFRGTTVIEPERVIVLTLSPVAARRR